MKGSMNNVGSPSGPGLHAGVEKSTKSNLKAKHKPMKVCANKKKNKVSDEQGLTKYMEGRMSDVEISNERVLTLEEKLKDKDAEIRSLKQTLQGYFNSPVIWSPNVYKVPLKEEDHKSWLEFKRLDEERPVQDSILSMGELKWPISVDHPFVIVICDFATKAFNEVIHMYAKKYERNILRHSQVMSCEYTKNYYFHMTVEAIEEGLLGVYRVVVACDRVDGSSSLVHFKLTDRKPTGKIAIPHLISLTSEYKTIQGVGQDLRTKLEKTRKSIKGKKNKDKVAAELTRQLKIEHKTIEEKCNTLAQQIELQVYKFRNRRAAQSTPCVDNEFTTGLEPRGGFHGGYDYCTRSMDFGLYVPMK